MISITRFTSDYAHGARESLAWEAFASYLVRPHPELAGVPKKQLPGFSLATFKGNYRTLANVEFAYALGLDVDAGPTLAQAAACWAGFDALIFTTASHTLAAHRFRIVLRLSRPVSASEYARVHMWARRRAANSGCPLGGAEGAKDASRFWYVPVAQGHYESAKLTGAPIMVDLALAEVPDEPEPAHELVPELVAAETSVDGAADLESACNIIASAKPGKQNSTLGAAAKHIGGLVRAGHVVAAEARAALIAAGCKMVVGDPNDPWTEAEIADVVDRAMARGEPRKPDHNAAFIDALAANAQPAAPPTFMRTDLGNAKFLVHEHGEDLRHFTEKKTWFIWDGARWKEDRSGEIMRRAMLAAEKLWQDAKDNPDDDSRKGAFAWAAKTQERARLTNMIALAESRPGIPVTAVDLDSDPWLLNVRNGTLDLRTGKLSKPDRSLLMTKCCATDYVPGAQSNLWDNFVARLTNNDRELEAYIRRVMGYALFGAWREKMFWFGYGPPDGSKSTFLGAVGAVLGDYHTSAAASTWMVQHTVGGNRGDLTRLRGARLVTTLEIKPGARFDPEIMKGITGGDAIVAAAKYEGEISFRPACALWFGANDRPTISDDDEGFWARCRVVPFTGIVPKAEQIEGLQDVIASPEHAPAVLAWMVRGCLEWQADGIGTCAQVETATNQYKDAMNKAAGFDECIEITKNPDDVISAKRLRGVYELWAKQAGVRTLLQGKAWGARLRKLGVTGGDDESRVNGKVVWRGLKLTVDAPTAIWLAD
jgi:P4 family phage/plasmid primase-like protien